MSKTNKCTCQIFTSQPCLFTFESDLTVPLLKAQRLERHAERCLLERRLTQIKIEKEFYASLGDESDRRLHSANINIGIAHGIQRLAAGVSRMVREYSGCQDGGNENASDVSDLVSEM